MAQLNLPESGAIVSGVTVAKTISTKAGATRVAVTGVTATNPFSESMERLEPP